MQRTTKILLLLGVIVLGSVLAYQPHFAYPYPILGDEYNHIALGKYILEERALPFQNPYLATSSPLQNFESGFHFFLAFLFLLIPGDPVLFYKYFVIAFFALNASLLFCLVRLWFKNYWAALLSVFFFGTIKSEAGMLAHQYFLPLSLGVTLLLLAFIFLHLWEARREKKLLIFLIGTLVTLALSYPPALFLFLGGAIMYGLSMTHSLHELFGASKKAFFWWLLGSTAALSTAFIVVLNFFDLLDQVVFPFGWNVQQTHYSPIFFFGIVPSAFALAGLYSTAVSKRGAGRIALFWFLFAFSLLTLFYLLTFNVLIPAPRLFFFYLVVVSILSGAGAAFIWRLGRQLLPKRRACSALFGAAFVATLFFHYSAVFSKPLPFHKILTPETYGALTFLKNEYPERGVVIADSFTSHAVYPVSGKYVVNLINANIGGGSTEGARIFLEKDCRGKIAGAFDRFSYLTEQAGIPLFLLAQKKQQEVCRPMLEPVYEGGVYLYRLYISTNDNPHAYEALAGNTLEGEGWIEYYDENGSIQGKVKSTGKIYTGTWSLHSRPRTCGVYPDFSKSVCNTISIRGTNVLFFESGGIPMPQRNSVIVSGNPYAL